MSGPHHIDIPGDTARVFADEWRDSDPTPPHGVRRPLTPEAYPHAEEAYRESSTCVDDALRWFGCVVDNVRSDVVEGIVEMYEASSASLSVGRLSARCWSVAR